MYTDMNNNPIPTTTFTNTDADGNENDYEARISIHDGKFVLEVRQDNPGSNQAGGALFPTGNRVLQKAITDNDATIETSFNDMYKMPLPNKAGMTIVPSTNNLAIPTFKSQTATVNNGTTIPAKTVVQDELETYKQSLHLDYPRGRILKIETTTPGEIQAEMAGYTTVDYQTSITRPKVFTWRMQDDRSLLMARAIRELELSNQILVSGTMQLIGVSQDLTNGLGFVNKPKKGLAAVKKVEFNFTDSLQVVIELSREEARVGEIVQSEENRMHHIEKQVASIQRTTDYIRATQSGQQQSPVEGIGSEVDATTGIVYRGS
jgi:hypothetical protein